MPRKKGVSSSAVEAENKTRFIGQIRFKLKQFSPFLQLIASDYFPVTHFFAILKRHFSSEFVSRERAITSPPDLIYCDETSHLGSSNYSSFFVARDYARYSWCPSLSRLLWGVPAACRNWSGLRCEFLNWRSGCCQNKAAASTSNLRGRECFCRNKKTYSIYECQEERGHLT